MQAVVIASDTVTPNSLYDPPLPSVLEPFLDYDAPGKRFVTLAGCFVRPEHHDESNSKHVYRRVRADCPWYEACKKS